MSMTAMSPGSGVAARAPTYASRPSSSAETTRARKPTALPSASSSAPALALWRPGAVTMVSMRSQPSERAIAANSRA